MEEEEDSVSRLLLGSKVIGLDWAKERKLVSVDLETMTVKVIDAPLLGWLEDIVALPNQQSVLMVYKHEIVQVDL